MPRRRYYRRAPKDKYSVEQTIINTPGSGTWTLYPAEGSLDDTRQINFSVLPPTETQGMRKVKHFTLTFTSTQDQQPFYYALVFVPSGYEPQRIALPNEGVAVPAYDANQFVLSQGVDSIIGGNA